jgi:hypothetical protein
MSTSSVVTGADVDFFDARQFVVPVRASRLDVAHSWALPLQPLPSLSFGGLGANFQTVP